MFVRSKWNQLAMGDSRLPLVDVNSDTVSLTWPLLLRAIDQADFIALDLVSQHAVTVAARLCTRLGRGDGDDGPQWLLFKNIH